MQSGTSGIVMSRKSCLGSFLQIYKEEGVRGLYRVSSLSIGGRKEEREREGGGGGER